MTMRLTMPPKIFLLVFRTLDSAMFFRVGSIQLSSMISF